jgi:hypothetical protein
LEKQLKPLRPITTPQSGERWDVASLTPEGYRAKETQMKTLPLAAAIAIVSASTAFAQGPAPNPSANQGPQAQTKQPIRQQVQNDLAQAGYTDIKIMPESFLVRAKDKSGNPVMMVINPDSITSITEVNRQGSNNTTTGSAAATGSSSSNGPHDPANNQK